MQLFSYNPHPFIFIAFSCSIICSIAFPSMSLWFFQHIFLLMPLFITLILLAQPSWARKCLNLMFVLRSTCFQAPCHMYAQIYMPTFSMPWFCLDLHVYAQIYKPKFRSMSLWAPCHAYAQIYVFMCSVPCLCVRSIRWLLCHVLLQPLCSLMFLFLVFGPFRWGVDLDPVVQAYIHTPRPISKGLDYFLMHVYVCLLASMLYAYVCLSRSRLCHALCPPWACACRSLGPLALCGCICPS